LIVLNYLTYTESRVIIETILNHYGRPLTSQQSIDFSPRNFSKNSLLARLLDANTTEEPMNSKVARRILGALEHLARSDSCWATLQSKPESLSPQQIVDLLVHLEDRIVKTKIKNKYEKAGKERTFFGRGEIHLKNGDTINATIRKFKTSFPYSRKDYSNLVGDLVSAPPFATVVELKEQVKSAYDKRLKDILKACEDDIDQHIKYVNNFHEIKNRLLSNEYEISFSNRTGRPYGIYITPTTLTLHSDARLIEVRKLNIFENFKAFKSSGNGFYRASGVEPYGFYRFTSVEENQRFYGGSSLRIGEKLYGYFLPSRILLACQIVLMTVTASNAASIRSLSRERIQETPSDFYLECIKTKTNKIIRPKIDKRFNPLAVKVINLLLKHDKNIGELGWRRSSDSVFCALQDYGEGFEFSLFAYTNVFKNFKEWHDLKPFKIEDLRDLAAQHDYLTHKDPFRVQAILSHRNLATTDEYLKDNVIGLLNRANVAEYMRRLAPSIVYSISPASVMEHGFDTNKVDPNLLFPVSNYDDVTNSHSDRWLMNMDEYRFRIDAESIKHCAYQMHYYKTHLDALINANKSRFVYYHLPRILFCKALHSLISSSEYGSLMQKAEEVFNGGE